MQTYIIREIKFDIVVCEHVVNASSLYVAKGLSYRYASSMDSTMQIVTDDGSIYTRNKFAWSDVEEKAAKKAGLEKLLKMTVRNNRAASMQAEKKLYIVKEYVDNHVQKSSIYAKTLLAAKCESYKVAQSIFSVLVITSSNGIELAKKIGNKWFSM